MSAHEDTIRDIAQEWGIEENCPRCGSPGEGFIGVEYEYGSPNRYDGVSEWRCLVCGLRIGRWSKRILADDEEEKRWGGRE